MKLRICLCSIKTAYVKGYIMADLPLAYQRFSFVSLLRPKPVPKGTQKMSKRKYALLESPQIVSLIEIIRVPLGT